MASIIKTIQNYNKRTDSSIVSVLFSNNKKLRVELFNGKRHNGYRATACYYDNERLIRKRTISREIFEKLESQLLNCENDDRLHGDFRRFIFGSRN